MGSFITNLHVRGAVREAVVAALHAIEATPAYLSNGPAGNQPDAAWISVYPDGIDQNTHGLQAMVVELSRRLHRPVIGFLVHDSDIFLYWLADDGQELDTYNSQPGYFEGEDAPPEGGDLDLLARYCRPGTSREQIARVLRSPGAGPDQGAASGPARGMKEMMLDRLRATYPMMKKQNPALPSLEAMLAKAEEGFATVPLFQNLAAASPPDHLFAEDQASELAKLLGIADGCAIDSFRYLENGEAMSGAVLRVELL